MASEIDHHAVKQRIAYPLSNKTELKNGTDNIDAIRCFEVGHPSAAADYAEDKKNIKSGS